MRLSKINIYPVKSLGGISINQALIEDSGLQYDRRWMLIDDKNLFLSQREFPLMALFDLSVEKNELKISFKGDSLAVPFEISRECSANVKIWSSSVQAGIYDQRINCWFSEKLESFCRLVLMTEKSKRKVSPFYAVRKFQDTVSFADAYPFLLASENSLNDLNGKMERPLPMNRFRPNFEIDGSDPFVEDSWKKIKIGNTVFHVVKQCARCVITTIDQLTGEKDGVEPLQTLASFRKKNGKVYFGQYLIAEKAGEIVKVGDKIEILESKN